MRSSVLIEKQSAQGATTRILVDTSPDIRQQLLNAEAGCLNGLLYTHDHADHTHGIDDLRVACYNARERIDTYASEQTFNMLTSRFGYCFQSPEGSEYPAIMNGHLIEPGQKINHAGQ